MGTSMEASSIKGNNVAEENRTARREHWPANGVRNGLAGFPGVDSLHDPARLVAQAATAVLGQVDQAVFMLARNGAVWFQNNSARRMLSSQSDLAVENGALTCPAEPDQERLDEMIASLPWTTDEDASANQVMRLGSGPGAMILVGRVVATAGDSGARVGLLIVHRVDEPDIRHTPSLLRQAFTLTRAEAAVATMIAGGNTPAEIAAHRNVSVETIRAQLRVLYSKTGTNRQAELVRLVHRLTALS